MVASLSSEEMNCFHLAVPVGLKLAVEVLLTRTTWTEVDPMILIASAAVVLEMMVFSVPPKS